jgi:hypothetical protein
MREPSPRGPHGSTSQHTIHEEPAYRQAFVGAKVKMSPVRTGDGFTSGRRDYFIRKTAGEYGILLRTLPRPLRIFRVSKV